MFDMHAICTLGLCFLHSLAFSRNFLSVYRVRHLLRVVGFLDCLFKTSGLSDEVPAQSMFTAALASLSMNFFDLFLGAQVMQHNLKYDALSPFVGVSLQLATTQVAYF